MIFSATFLVGALLAALAVYVPVSCYINYRKCPGIPGPIWAKISSLWLFQVTCRSGIWIDIPTLFEKYDSHLVRVAPNRLATNDPELWRYFSTPKCRFLRGTWHDGMSLDANNHNVFSCRDEKAHTALRAKLIRGYSGKEIPELEQDIDNRIHELLSLIRRESAQGKPVEFAHLSQFFTLDVLTQIAFEKPFGFLTQNKDVFNYIKEIEDFLVVLELCCNFPSILRIVSNPLLSFLKPKPTDKTGMGAMLGVAQDVVKRRYAPGAKQYDDMLGSFMKGGLTMKEAENETLVQILAGSDSTSTAIRMTFLHIVANPSVYIKLRAEIDEHAHTFSKPIVKSAEARPLKYLQCCIKEGLRVFPPLNGLLNKITPPGGETWDGQFIPEGVEISWSPFGIHHRKDIYGEDAKIFRPERWLEAEAMNDGGAFFQKMERTWDLTFGSGKYTCLGKTIAQMELDKIFVVLLQNFDWGIVNPVKPLSTRCPGMHVQHDLWLLATERTME